MATVTAGTKFMGVSSSTDTTERKSTSLNDNTEVVTIEDIIQSVTGDSEGYTQTIVNISSTQILAMGTTPVELLPAAGVGKYYEWEGFVEYSHVTTPYAVSSNDMLMFGYESEYSGCLIQTLLITQADSFAAKIGQFPQSNTSSSATLPDVELYRIPLNDRIILTSWNGVDPTLGDGTMRVIIKYKVKTFGA